MALSELKTAPVSLEQVESWSRERSDEELHSLLGRRMAAIAFGKVEAEDETDAGLFDLMTV